MNEALIRQLVKPNWNKSNTSVFSLRLKFLQEHVTCGVCRRQFLRTDEKDIEARYPAAIAFCLEFQELFQD